MIRYNHIHLGNITVTTASSVINDTLVIGWARCAPGDNFNKSVGRCIARDRLIHAPDKCFNLTLTEAKVLLQKDLKSKPLLTNDAIFKVTTAITLNDINHKYIATLITEQFLDKS